MSCVGRKTSAKSFVAYGILKQQSMIESLREIFLKDEIQLW